MKSRSATGGLVYSTDAGRMCPDCRQPLAQCRCKALAAATPAGDGIVRVARETKGRGGKAVTVVRGLPLDAAALAKMGTQLKSLCGTGGTAKDGVVEVQGDHRDKVIAHLQAAGYTVKRSGG
ncbi:translation initiation factor Sui1 [Aquincola tertiaricarbonis]|uniref:Translation initiation factor Sui1 n=1 Tax=Aquincola tertiaricarbonis TaxID=391953 RepID=A0ABY4SHZ9_AQUTE|nr:translation initiation factor Sui1 [Aquincola tertiaricarbonis]URI11762.1 translation initiation factor Sui1 [Aquincola tertiaricarbonis]